ncbi:transcriptional regulator, TraR/DksA family [Desulfovibrio sp. X2]|uniref:TraR/DksA family transcriptional regulator n=1 Tax=Desulfovibrio sp. X2 TaxID=941449 RepID=UPI000358D3C5|nr:TraR/DksA C4-type zinc finger protein [Desulfovibrio sp. X2]EPR43572.1 transcriptional regulator, TraR/DksA family [Desulfovibrio sp. X2]
MTPEQKNSIRRTLEAKLDELLAISPAETSAETCADENEYASRLSEQSLNVALREREARAVKEVREALARLDSPDFGICEECEDDIGTARLAARPTATLCVHCQARLEKGLAFAI